MGAKRRGSLLERDREAQRGTERDREAQRQRGTERDREAERHPSVEAASFCLGPSDDHAEPHISTAKPSSHDIASQPSETAATPERRFKQHGME